MVRIHYGTGRPLSNPGGTHSVIRGLSSAQEEINILVILVDQIKLLGKKYQTSSNLPKGSKINYVNEFHFCLSYLHILLRDPLLVLRSDLNILHFHGPWYLESRIQNPKAKIRNLFKFILEFALLHSFTQIVCVSQAFADLLSTRFKIDPRKITVISAGIDTNRFTPTSESQKISQPQRALQIGTVRRLVPRMGLEILISSMLEIEDAHLTIVGVGPLEEELKQLILELGLLEKVTLSGYIKDEDLPDFYRNIDLCVIPSTALEGFCITALEAMACGIPVIATNLDGLKESVGKCDSRLLFEGNSIPALVAQVNLAKESFVGDSARFRKYSLGYSWTKVALTLEELIQTQTKQKR